MDVEMAMNLALQVLRDDRSCLEVPSNRKSGQVKDTHPFIALPTCILPVDSGALVIKQVVQQRSFIPFIFIRR